MNSDGTEPVNLTRYAGNDYGPSWSPDGTMIAFQGMNEGVADLYLYGLENESLTRLIHDKYDDNDPYLYDLTGRNNLLYFSLGYLF